MPWFRKNPIPIEAREFTRANAEELAQWCGASINYEPDSEDVYFTIPTLEGSMKAAVGSWIIKGTAGEFYPCKKDIFLQTYREV